MHSKNPATITLERVRLGVFREIKSSVERKVEISHDEVLSSQCKQAFGGEAEDYKVVIKKLEKDPAYVSFLESLESFNSGNMKAVEAYFLNPILYGEVNVVLSKIIVGVIAFGSVSTVAASVIGGSVLIPVAGIASAYLFSRIMTTYMQENAGDNQGYILDKSMIVAIEPFRLLLDKCADIIGMQILSGKVEKVEEVVKTVAQKMMELDPKQYLRKQEGEIQEGVQFCVCGQLIEAKAFVRANRQSKFDIGALNRDRLNSMIYLLENCPLNSAIIYMQRHSDAFIELEKKAVYVLSDIMEQERKKSDMQVAPNRSKR